MPDRSLQIACFDVAGAGYGLPVSALREIIRIPEISKLPDAPELVEGLIELRGKLVPVVDLVRAVNGASVSPSERARVAVVSAPGLLLGLCVDAATEVIEVSAADCQSVPPVAQSAAQSLVHSVIQREGQPPIMILSIEGLIEAVSASGIRGAAA